MPKIFENPPPEKMTCSQAPSGSKTDALGFTCVAPTEVTKGQPEGKEGLKRVALRDSVPLGVRQTLSKPATPKSPEL